MTATPRESAAEPPPAVPRQPPPAAPPPTPAEPPPHPVRTPAASAPAKLDDQRRAASSQSFWSVAVGVPAVISVLRLVVEAGGELQTTLLLVANVNPVNLVAAFAATSSRLVSGLLILLFAISAVLAASVDPNPRHGDRDRRPLVVRWKHVAPMWFVILVLVVALATWQILYLPLLLPAVAAMFQLSPSRLHPNRWVQAAFIVPLLAAYGWFVGPTVRDAAGQREYVVVAIFVAPALLALAVTGPIHRLTVRPLATAAPLVLLVAMLWSAYAVVTTPVLPLTVTSVDAGAEPDEDIRGHIVAVDDVHTILLQERGGVRYIPVDDVRSTVLCPGEEELPRYRLRVHGFHVEDSILEGLGRRERPAAPINAACRTPS
ncbi:hypothetical protein O7627_01675 [Solwaraspora sp. WMMD1047]|uniref:hypothetical protein n=1 Tax=Solwaraspora sp. WMMD1047 TaxID=3016102 RepID=UPI0024160FCA|nr:hypothetical protein [Solwaraspora sp. WMMD1047]MDG4828010.1 hypothetical protein [Solwaraspora sp. WMMD1047]